MSASDTPRTDNASGWPVGHHGRIESRDLVMGKAGPFVHSQFARELERENAALRALLAEPYQFFRFGHKALMPWGKALEGWCERAEKLGVGKEAQP